MKVMEDTGGSFFQQAPEESTGKKDYLGAYNSTDSQVDFKNYFGCDVRPAVMSTDILNFI